MIPDTPILPDKDPAESVVVEFAFDGELAAIDSAVVAVTLAAGTDAAPAALLDGLPQIQGASVLQRISGGVADANYRLHCTATHGEDVRVRAGVLPVRAA